MHRLGLLFIATCMVLTSGAARAGWRYAEWGMSEREIISASNGEATRHYEANRARWGEYPSAKARAHEMGQDFEVWFYTDPLDGLYAIRLVPTGIYWCIDIRESAMARWGYQVRFDEGDPYWEDRRSGNRASVIGFRGCTVKLEPLPAPGR